jgi:DNA-binding LacI/PurR family transcriptional regulator
LPERLCGNASLIDNPAGMTTMSRHEQGYRTAIEALSSNTRLPLDGVIITSESVARGALIALRNIRVTPGKDIRIATHKDAESSALIGLEDCVIPIE